MRKVLLAEDHGIVIKGINIIFEAEFKTHSLDVVKNTGSLMNALKNNNYELVIVDLSLEDGDTLHLVTDILNLYPKLNILIFSGKPEELYAQKLYRDGVMGYLSKHSEDSIVIEAIKTCMQGNRYMSEKFKTALLTETKHPANVNQLKKLTSREMDVANLMQQGKKPSEICRELNLQSSTVATFKMKIFSKLNITNVIELKQLFMNYQNSGD